MKPSIGRIVHVLVDPATNNGADVAPAVITRVWSDTCVNARVLLDQEGILWLTSITLHADRDALDAFWAENLAQLRAAGNTDDIKPTGAFWPPRV
jgi:hypothetical protein